MGENTRIEWAQHTFNPWVGCTKVSLGCDHCYAESWAKRTGSPGLWNGERRRTSEANWRKPIAWNRAAEGGPRPRVFCASLADVFDNEVPAEWRADLFRLIRATPNLDWLLLTKRIGNAAKMIERALIDGHLLTSREPYWPWPNVWLGATVVNQDEADRDITKLLEIPARVRFLSCEPLLGPIDLRYAAFNGADSFGSLEGLHWAIAGGESGPRARPCVIGHIRDLVRQCHAAGIPCFVKQLGSRPTNREGVPHPLKDRKGGDISEFPGDLRVREFPR